MIRQDDGFGITQNSLRFFAENKEYLGEIQRVEMRRYAPDLYGWEVYPLRIIGSECEIWLSGCHGAYGAAAAHGTAEILRQLGYPEEICRLPFRRDVFELGPPDDPGPIEETKSAEAPNLDDIAHEVFETIKDYVKEHGIAPTLREIAKCTQSLSSISAVQKRVKQLEEAGLILRYPHKARGLVILEED